RVGWGVAPADVVTATSKVRRAFDVVATAQAAALASLDDPGEIARRRELNAAGGARLGESPRRHGPGAAAPGAGGLALPRRRRGATSSSPTSAMAASCSSACCGKA